MEQSGKVVDVDFAVEDLLFSRTDEQGVIVSCNAAFIRVNGHEWDALEGTPHNILRDADMPRGVFSKIWDAIQAGNPVAAYIKNKSAGGGTYWCLANFVPLEDGYMALSLKPSCGILGPVQKVYGDLIQLEADGLSPKKSAAELDKMIISLGYSDYVEFMSFALRDEIAARKTQMGREEDRMSSALSLLFDDVRQLDAQTRKITQAFHNTEQIPYNMRLQSGRLEGNDGPISVISGNHRLMTQSMEEHLARFGADSTVGAEAVRQVVYKIALSSLMSDMASFLQTVREGTPDQPDRDVELLRGLAGEYHTTSLSDVQDLSKRIEKFSTQCRSMRRMLSGLELSRIMCKIERSKFDGDLDGLDEIVNRLGNAQLMMSDHFDDILSCVARILTSSDDIRRLGRRAEGSIAA
ncbi:MAG: hypothetical protein AB8B71_06365 [Paracoccaceae bacterium]